MGFENNPITDSDRISPKFSSDAYILERHLDAAMVPKTYHFAYNAKTIDGKQSLNLAGFFLILAIDESETLELSKQGSQTGQYIDAPPTANRFPDKIVKIGVIES